MLIRCRGLIEVFLIDSWEGFDSGLIYWRTIFKGVFFIFRIWGLRCLFCFSCLLPGYKFPLQDLEGIVEYSSKCHCDSYACHYYISPAYLVLLRFDACSKLLFGDIRRPINLVVSHSNNEPSAPVEYHFIEYLDEVEIIGDQRLHLDKV